MKRKRIIILGAGLAGLSAAFFLRHKGHKACVFEKESVCGGLCRSVVRKGFTFDISGHFLHFQRPQIRTLVRQLLGNNLVRHCRKAYVYAFARYLDYPFQFNFHTLPSRIADECRKGLIAASNNGRLTPEANFQDWLQARFGAGITRYFMIPYNKKFWHLPLSQLSYDWAQRFVPVAGTANITASGTRSSGYGYNRYFWYPRQGGINVVAEAFAASVNSQIYHCCEAKEIDLEKRRVVLSNGRKEKFDILFSTLPLPQFYRIARGIPQRIAACFEKLRWLSIYTVNMGFTGTIVPGRHWVYFAGSSVPFFRLGFFHNFSSCLTPPGTSSLFAEVSHLPGRRIDKKEIRQRIQVSLKKTGIIENSNAMRCLDDHDIEYGYPVYDRNCSQARNTILSFLKERGIISHGRYGGWQYFSMEDVIWEARHIARQI